MSTSPGTEQALRFSSPQEEALLTLMRSADFLHRAFQQRLKPFGLTSAQYNVLRILRGARETGLTCSAVGRMMITPEPDITRLLARLKTQKFVRQQRDSQDRRVVWTHVTPQGVKVLENLEEIVNQAPRELLRELTCSEVAELTRLLRKAQVWSPQADRNPEPAQAPPDTSSTAKLPSLRSARSGPLGLRLE
jgi:DNA-binding MarR family transcriptional regulator